MQQKTHSVSLVQTVSNHTNRTRGKTMSYSHLTITDRIKIETYLDLGLKPCQIASKLGVHKSTISRELSRCKNGYSAALAQEQSDHRAKQKGRKSCLTPKLKKEIEKGLKASWSPEQICGRYQLEKSQW